MKKIMTTMAALATLALLVACQRPPAPAQDKPPEPQATSKKGDGGG